MLIDLHGRRALVVDDDAMVRFIITTELEDAGLIVTEAADGAAALERLREEGFDLLVTDIRMPGIDGWTLAERAREMHAGMPIIYVTGWSDEAPRPTPGSEILSKPFKPTQLAAAAVRLIDHRPPATA